MERDYPRPERIRALIEQIDRVCRESEDVSGDADQTMKHGAFWPDRRKAHRPATWKQDRGDKGDAA